METLMSILSGGATGIVGATISAFFRVKEKRIELDGKARIEETVLKQIQAEAEGAAKQAAAEVELAAVAGSYADAQHSLTAGKVLSRGQNWFIVLLDFVRGMTRPLLTLFLVSLTAGMLWEGGVLDPTTQATVLYMTSTAVLWWFGDRGMKGGAKR